MASSQKDTKINQLVKRAETGDLDKIKYLVEEKGVDINSWSKDGENALCTAISAGKNQVVKYLLSEGANTEIQRKTSRMTDHDLTPLCIAVSDGNVTICKLLIEHGANLNHKSKHYDILDASIYSDNIAF